MRTLMVLALTVLSAAACARGAGDGPGVATAATGRPTASSSPSAAADDVDAPLKFAQCMRDHGMTWFPDPDASGRMRITTPRDLDPKKFEAAQQACKQYAPGGGTVRKPTAEEIEQARRFARCMRENGVTGFPDPSADGGISIDAGKLGTGPGSPTFDKAEEACRQYLPEPPAGGGKSSLSDVGSGAEAPA